MRAAHKEHTIQIQLSAIRNFNNFWRFINSKRIDSSIPEEMCLEDTYAKNGRDIATLFSRHFKSSFKTNNESNLSFSNLDSDNHYPESTNFELVKTKDSLEVSLNDVLAAIEALKNSYYSPPDGIPAIFIKKSAPIIAYPLLRLFSKSSNCTGQRQHIKTV